MLWLLAVATTAVLVLLGVFIQDISRVPAAAQPAALSASARTPDRGTTAGGTRHQVPSRHGRPPAAPQPRVTDTTSGLSYQRLASPWSQGCPSHLNTPMFDWSAGENAVAGKVSMGGSVIITTLIDSLRVS